MEAGAAGWHSWLDKQHGGCRGTLQSRDQPPSTETATDQCASMTGQGEVSSHRQPVTAASTLTRIQSLCTYDHAHPLPLTSTGRTGVRRCESAGTHVSVFAWECDRCIRWCKAMDQASPAVDIDIVFRSTAQHSSWRGSLRLPFAAIVITNDHGRFSTRS